MAHNIIKLLNMLQQPKVLYMIALIISFLDYLSLLVFHKVQAHYMFSEFQVFQHLQVT